MATFRVPIFGYQLRPDASSVMYFQGYDVHATNVVWKQIVAVWEDSVSKRVLRGAFEVPSNYTSTPEIVVIWTSATTTGDVVWDFEYRVVSGDDTSGQSLDQSGSDEAAGVTDTAPTDAHLRLEATITLTGSHWSSNSTCEFILARDSTNSSDDLADEALVFDAMFSYSDT